MHISIILATVPCIRPWLIDFESGCLKAPTRVSRESRCPTQAPKLAPLLPIALPPFTSDDPIASTPGSVGHRKRVEAWPVQMWATQEADERATIRTVKHDPEYVREAARRRSLDSASSKGISWTKTFSVNIEDTKQQSAKQPSELLRERSTIRKMSYQPGLEDFGKLLGALPKAKHSPRIGSVESV